MYELKTKLRYICAILFPCVLNANTLDNVTIEKIHINRNTGEYAYIITSMDHVSPISCHTIGGMQFVLPLSTELDRLVYSSLLAAHFSKAKVKLVGNGDCLNGMPIETLRSIYTKP